MTWIHGLVAVWLLIGLVTWLVGCARHLPAAFRCERDRLDQWILGVEVFITLLLVTLMGPVATWIYVTYKDDL